MHHWSPFSNQGGKPNTRAKSHLTSSSYKATSNGKLVCGRKDISVFFTAPSKSGQNKELSQWPPAPLKQLFHVYSTNLVSYKSVESDPRILLSDTHWKRTRESQLVCRTQLKFCSLFWWGSRGCDGNIKTLFMLACCRQQYLSEWHLF